MRKQKSHSILLEECAHVFKSRYLRMFFPFANFIKKFAHGHDKKIAKEKINTKLIFSESVTRLSVPKKKNIIL